MLFSWKFYTAGTNFTRPPVVTVATNLNSDWNRKSRILRNMRIEGEVVVGAIQGGAVAPLSEWGKHALALSNLHHSLIQHHKDQITTNLYHTIILKENLKLKYFNAFFRYSHWFGHHGQHAGYLWMILMFLQILNCEKVLLFGWAKFGSGKLQPLPVWKKKQALKEGI